MKFLYLTICVACLAHIAYANPIPDEDVSTEKISVADEVPKSEEPVPADPSKKESAASTPEKVEATTKAQPRVDKPKVERSKVEKSKVEKSKTEKSKVEKVKEENPKEPVSKAETPSSNPSEMEIKSWGPNDYEYSFKTENQRQAKAIHIEDKPEDKDNPYDVSDKGSFSTFNTEQGYEYKVEYTADSDGYRPKVSFSFHS